MEKTYKVRAYDIDYCVEDEDVCQEIDNDPEIDDNSEEYYDAINARIARIKSELPKDMLFSVTCEPEDLEDEVCNAITNESGWLINGFSYDIL